MAGDLEIRSREGLDFYISYAGRDRQWAEWVGWQLREAGHSFELDLWHRLPGDNVILAREDALGRAGRVLALCSSAYFSGGFTEQDWTAVMAARHGQPGRLIPVWIEDLDDRQLPGILSAVQPIKLFGMSEADAARSLLTALAGDLGPEGAPEFPGPAMPAISSQEAGLGPRLPAAGRPDAWHVPPRNPSFIGRDGILVSVREGLLRGSPGTVVLQGPGGVGKTQLSIEYAHRSASDYDTVWVFNGEQPDLIAGQFTDLASVLSAASDAKDAKIAVTAVLAMLQARERWLLIFDNVDDPDHLAGFLPDGPGHALITARAGDWREIGTLIPVEDFSRAESTALLTTAVAGLSPADANGMAEALGDLPLALAQAAGTLQSGLPAAEFLRLLDSQATQVLSAARPRSYPATLAAATLIALDRLTADNPEAAGLLCLCGYLAPEPIPMTWFRDSAKGELPSFIAEAGGLPQGSWQATQAYVSIRDIGLGRVDQNGLRVHRLTQAILRDHTAQDQASYRNAVNAILTAAMPPDTDDPAYWPAWSLLVPHLLMAVPGQGPAGFRAVACAAARYLLVSGQAKAALAMTQRLHKAWSVELGADHPDTLTMAQHLVHAIHDTGDYAQALDLQQDVLSHRRRTLGEDHPDTLRSASDLAVTLSSLGRDKEALPLNQGTYDRRRRVLGEDHPDTLRSANNLASTLGSLGRDKEALPLKQDTYDRRRRVLGEDHPDTLASAGNLASTLGSLGRRKEALPLDQDTYDRRRRVLGEDHPDTLASAGNLAGTLGSLGRRKEALALDQDTYDQRRRALGEDHPDTLTSAGNLANTLGSLGRRKEALPLKQDTYDRRRRVLGEDHPDTLASAGNLANTLGSLGRYKEALPLAQDTYDRCRRVLGEDHPDTLASAGNLANTLGSLGRRKEALALDQDTYDQRRRVLGEDHPDTLTSAGNLASTLGSLGRHKEALALKQDTYDRCRRVLGEDHPNTLASANNLARELYELGRRTESLALNQDTYDRCRRVLGEEHPDTLASAGNLAANLEGVGRRSAALRLKGKKMKKKNKKL